MVINVFRVHIFSYDANTSVILKTIVSKLHPIIDDYKIKIRNKQDDDQANDIPFGTLYQDLLQRNIDENIISLLLHLDGTPLTQSSKLKLWLFSGALLEVPPKLRYRRFNMVVISFWLGYKEPPTKLWLKNAIDQLAAVKEGSQ